MFCKAKFAKCLDTSLFSVQPTTPHHVVERTLKYSQPFVFFNFIRSYVLLQSFEFLTAKYVCTLHGTITSVRVLRYPYKLKTFKCFSIAYSEVRITEISDQLSRVEQSD